MEESFKEVKELDNLNEEQLKSYAESLGRVLDRGVILLIGELGAGKTTFVKGLARGLEISEEEVRSPTFTLMNVYVGRKTLYHVDLYRLDDPESLFYIGLDETLEDDEGIVAVEWADLFPEFWEDLNGIVVKIYIKPDGKRRVILMGTEKEGKISESIEIWKKGEETGQILEKE
ncbi:MAG: tRNA (adenosine(37)-N6)-threonylcarbamoyltransferase complex ATPase subunit type 1 TsaE [Thermotogaceae bacterium]|nr:tRNA (adenosine(37)-N6)-threonylcarbamoyltransferase complex ATPase subunit type 1 TsaE [Thermotogaceae bacterium]